MMDLLVLSWWLAIAALERPLRYLWHFVRSSAGGTKPLDLWQRAGRRLVRSVQRSLTARLGEALDKKWSVTQIVGQRLSDSECPRACGDAEAMEGERSTSDVPIVFVHASNSDYLKYSLGQARASNPDSTICLIGDSLNKKYEFVNHYLYEDYFNGAMQFSQIYRHYNTTGAQYELFNFQRWFILREFLEANKLQRCLYLDSDVMLYGRVTDEIRKFEQFDFTLSAGICGSVFFLNNVTALDDFCQFVMDMYSKKDKYRYHRMLFHFAARRISHLPGGVCDMTAFQLYRENRYGEIGEVSHIIDGSIYDSNVNIPHPGFEMRNGIKKVTWKNGVPYGTVVKMGKDVKFNSLHFQGKAKALMGQFFVPSGSGSVS